MVFRACSASGPPHINFPITIQPGDTLPCDSDHSVESDASRRYTMTAAPPSAGMMGRHFLAGGAELPDLGALFDSANSRYASSAPGSSGAVNPAVVISCASRWASAAWSDRSWSRLASTAAAIASTTRGGTAVEVTSVALLPKVGTAPPIL